MIIIGLSIEWETQQAQETQQFTADPILNNKIKSVTAGLLSLHPKYVFGLSD